MRRLFSTSLAVIAVNLAIVGCGSPRAPHGCQVDSECPQGSVCSSSVCVNCTGGRGSVDAPDDEFADANCDGIDGDLNKAIFVAPSDKGGDDTHSGTPADPVATISKALDLAGTGEKDVYAMEGTYSETATLVVPSGVSIYGGYDGAGPYGPFTGPREGATIVKGAPTALSISGMDNVIDHLTIIPAGGTSSDLSSIGILAANTTSLTLNALVIHAGVAFKGADGGKGGAGQKGDDGKAGGSFVTSNQAVAGGAGGALFASGGNGGNGGATSGTTGITGSEGAAGGTPTSSPLRAGGTGQDGADGSPGSPAAAGTVSGTFAASGFVPSQASSGGNGLSGAGGGGGSGGWGNNREVGVPTPMWYYYYGGGGGGGGGGGTGGKGGSGGQQGGASVAVVLYSTALTTVKNCTLTTGSGGAGGIGGAGGDPGPGGAGASGGIGSSGTWASGDGGKGGTGGPGGPGGPGGGGAGGPSIPLVYTGTIDEQGTNTYGNGAGGLGGDAPGGNAGPAGLSQPRLQL